MTVTATQLEKLNEMDATLYRTQKARGVNALRKHSYQTPKFNVTAAAFLNENRELLDGLIGQFVRPCPMVPRHGFVDSRFITTLEEAEKILNETLAAEPEAELLLMPAVNAAYSAIWTPGHLIIGPSNDGATAGKESISIPVQGEPRPFWYKEKTFGYACSEAGITESPYVEILFEESSSIGLFESKVYGDTKKLYKTYFVQLRNGPALPNSVDYVEKKFKVKHIVLADGDLLEWETKVKAFPIGTVVYHPGGTLASHYAVHAVLNHIPVIVSHKPKVGEIIKPTTVCNECNVADLKLGFYLGVMSSINTAHAGCAMLTGCHSVSKWIGTYDVLLGFAMGCAYRLTVTATLGEFRHKFRCDELTRREINRIENHSTSRESIYNKTWKDSVSPKSRILYVEAMESFRDDKWPPHFGGVKWYDFARLGAAMFDAIIAEDSKLALETFNKLVNAAHNGGWAFNKFMDGDVMSMAVTNNLSVALPCAPTLYETLKIAPKAKKMAAAFWNEEINMTLFNMEERKTSDVKQSVMIPKVITTLEPDPALGLVTNMVATYNDYHSDNGKLFLVYTQEKHKPGHYAFGTVTVPGLYKELVKKIYDASPKVHYTSILPPMYRNGMENTIYDVYIKVSVLSGGQANISNIKGGTYWLENYYGPAKEVK